MDTPVTDDVTVPHTDPSRCPAPSTNMGLRICGTLGHYPVFAAEISQLLKPSAKPEAERQLPLRVSLGKFSEPASLGFLSCVVGTVILPAPD